jgi:hypothetical protein
LRRRQPSGALALSTGGELVSGQDNRRGVRIVLAIHGREGTPLDAVVR